MSEAVYHPGLVNPLPTYTPHTTFQAGLMVCALAATAVVAGPPPASH